MKPDIPVCGTFLPDPDVPPDHSGHGACLNCHLIGGPGDAHHPVPDRPEVDVQQLRAGGRGDD